MALYARQMQFTWDQIHYLEVRPYQNVKWIRQAVFKISRSQAINCCGGHLGFGRMPQINSVQGLSSIQAISKYEVNPTSGFQDIAFTSNILHRVQCLSSNCCGGHLGFHGMPKIDSVRGLGSIKAISKCEVNLTSGFQDIVFTSNILHRVQC